MPDLSDQLLRWRELRPNFKLWRENQIAELLGEEGVHPIDEESLREFLVLDDELRRTTTWSGNHVISDPVAHQALKELQEAHSAELCTAEGELVDDDLAWDMFHSSFNPVEYAERLIFSKRLVLLYEIPPELLRLAEEGRECFALGLYTAAISVSRILVEAAIGDIAVRIGRIESKDALVDARLCEKISSLVPKKSITGRKIDAFIEEASEVIHANQRADPSTAIELYERALGLVQSLYGRYRTEYLAKPPSKNT